MSYYPSETSAPAQNQSEPRRQYPLEYLLSTEEGFTRSIDYTSTADRIVIILLAVGGLGLAYNVFNVITTIVSRPSAAHHFWALFFSVIDTTGHVNPLLVLEVWVPVIVVPLLIIVLIISRLTRASTLRKVFHEYQHGGFVAYPQPTGLTKAVDKNTEHAVMIVAGPGVHPQWGVAAAQQIQFKAASDAQYAQAITKMAHRSKKAEGLIDRRFPVFNVDPSIPEGIFVAALPEKDADSPCIAVPKGSRWDLYHIKKTNGA